jgi:hypothetical protein
MATCLRDQEAVIAQYQLKVADLKVRKGEFLVKMATCLRDQEAVITQYQLKMAHLKVREVESSWPNRRSHDGLLFEGSRGCYNTVPAQDG